MTPTARRRGVIPAPAFLIAALTMVALWMLMFFAFVRDSSPPPPEVLIIAPILVSALLGGYILLIGYIYGDAKRRGMKYVAWTFLAALAPSAIGIILYFILRDPLQVHCTKCGCAIHPGFVYCPHCGGSMGATCLECHKVTQSGWTHCAWCGAKL